MEHLQRFGLARDPFRNEPQPEFWFESRAARDARARLLRCLRQGKELSVLCGEVGSGTSSLARLVLDELDPDRFEVGMLVVGRGVEPAWLRRAVATQLGVDEPLSGRAEAMRQLYERLVELRREGRRAVIVIDEAQALAGSEALGELVAMLNFEADDALLLSALLVGSLDLDRLLAGEPALLGRCDLRVRLGPLGGEEARAYFAHRLRVAGGDPTLLAPEVADSIALRAGGLPRRMNALADNALFEAHLAGRAQPAVVDVERAARDLPWAQSPAETASDRQPAAFDRQPAESAKADAAPAFRSAEQPLDRRARAAASAALAALDVPDLDADHGAPLGEVLEEEMEGTLEASAPPAPRSGTPFDREPPPRLAITDAEPHGNSGRERDPQASRSWNRARLASLDDDVIGGSPPPVPDESEIDGLFVDLVDAVPDPEPRRR